MMVGAAVAVLRAEIAASMGRLVGVVAGISAIFSIFFIPWIVIGVWVIVASVLLFVSSGRRTVARS